jgi:hypothetical protein
LILPLNQYVSASVSKLHRAAIQRFSVELWVRERGMWRTSIREGQPSAGPNQIVFVKPRIGNVPTTDGLAPQSTTRSTRRVSSRNKQHPLTESLLSVRPASYVVEINSSSPFAQVPSTAIAALQQALARRLVGAMNGLGFGTSPSKEATLRTVPVAALWGRQTCRMNMRLRMARSRPGSRAG